MIFFYLYSTCQHRVHKSLIFRFIKLYCFDIIIYLFICISLCIQGAGTTESTLTEIFASRPNKQIRELSEAYLASRTF